MKTKKLVLVLLALALSSCGSIDKGNASGGIASSEGTSQASDSLIAKKLASKFYAGAGVDGNLDPERALSLPTYFFAEAEEIPYVRLDELINNVLTPFLFEGEAPFEVKGGVMTNVFNKTSLNFDVETNEIACDDIDLFYMTMEGSNFHGDDLAASQDGTAKLLKDKCSRTKGKPVDYKLDKYSQKLLRNSGALYLPFDLASIFFLAKFGQTISFNGADYYLAGGLNLAMYADLKSQALNGYGSAYYGGPYASVTSRSETFAKHFYGIFLFCFENFYGKLDSLSFKNIDSELESRGYKAKMLSSDPKVANAAMGETVNALFNDGGHTGFYGSGVMSGPCVLEDVTLIQESFQFDERVKKSLADSKTLAEKRGSEAGKMASPYATKASDYLKTSGKTAVISFDSFSLTAEGKLPTKETIEGDFASTFGILYHCFREIEKNASIKNVILDVSLNGGGAAVALGESFGFLTDEDISFTTKNPITGAISTEVVQYDTDLDGDFSDKDSYAGKYNFFILTSSYSFSCGNALPTLAKENNWAKIIGQRSGGGDCVVGYGSSLEGTCWRMSSTDSIIRNDGSSVDDGAAVDYEIDLANFYDVSYLDGYLAKVEAKA